MQRLTAITALTGALACGSAIAQDTEDRSDGNKDSVLELTMALIPANAQTPAALTTTIELPKSESTGVYIPSAQGVEHSAGGLDTASLACEETREFGQATAGGARDDRENAGRAAREAASHERPPAPETPDPPGPPTR